MIRRPTLTPTTMSLIARRAIARPIASLSNLRFNTTKASPGPGITTTRQDQEKSSLVEPTEAPKHVVTADVVSGAPSKYFYYTNTSNYR
jgi:hypothetical protein